MSSNFIKNDPSSIYGSIDLDDEFITNAYLIDRYVGGQLWGVGGNSQGQLGISSVVSTSSLVQIGALTDWSMIVNNGGASFAIKQDGSLWSWGFNSLNGGNGYGNLGLGDIIDRSSPTQIGSLTSWVSVVGGTVTAMAIRNDNTLWAWGQNDRFQISPISLGVGIGYSSPIQISSTADWKQVAQNGSFWSAIKTDGTLWVQGANDWGQLGIGIASATNISTPTQIGTLTNWKQVACGDRNTFALKTDGTLWSWGDSTNFGTGYSSPQQIGTSTDWKTIVASGFSAFLLKNDNSLWAWGLNTYGQLGIGNATLTTSLRQVGSSKNWKQIATCGISSSTAAVKTDGTLWVWGRNDYGQLGLGNTTNKSSPTQVGYLTNWKTVTIDDNHLLAITFKDLG